MSVFVTQTTVKHDPEIIRFTPEWGDCTCIGAEQCVDCLDAHDDNPDATIRHLHRELHERDAEIDRLRSAIAAAYEILDAQDQGKQVSPFDHYTALALLRDEAA